MVRESVEIYNTLRPHLSCPVLNNIDTFNSHTEENVMNQYVKRTQRDYPLSFKKVSTYSRTSH
ncbi:transposase [Yersinia similis]|nr:transposase [Yersinia similis]